MASHDYLGTKAKAFGTAKMHLTLEKISVVPLHEIAVGTAKNTENSMMMV